MSSSTASDRLVRRTGPAARPRALLTAVLGVVLLVAGLAVHRAHSPYPGGITTTATVTAVETGNTRRGSTDYTAVYTFRTADGRRVSVRDPAAGSSRPERGARVEVSYRAGAPGQARRVPGFDWWGWLIITLGAVLTPAGALLAVRAPGGPFSRR